MRDWSAYPLTGPVPYVPSPPRKGTFMAKKLHQNPAPIINAPKPAPITGALKPAPIIAALNPILIIAALYLVLIINVF
jgi:hypothetical protein